MAKFLFTETAVMELIATEGGASGGAAVQTLMWMEGLHHIGHEIFLAKRENDLRPIKPEYQKFHLVSTFNSEKGIKKIRWATYRLPKFYKALKKVKPDFLYESVPGWNSYITALFCKMLGIKHVIRISNDNLLDKRLKNTASTSHQFFLILGLKWSDYILAQNEYQLRKLKKKFPKKPIVKFYNPIKINPEFLSAKKEMKGYFTWIANFRYQKNLKLLYQIATLLPDEEFKIAGVPTKHYDEESKKYVDKLQKLDNVYFMGKLNRSEILPFLANAKFLINTSRYEGFSNTFLEAMNSGTPIISSNLVNPDQIIEKYNLGLIYTDEIALIQKLKNLEMEDYQNMSFSCINYLNQNHDHLLLSKKLVKFLNH
ncbi:Glycosyltransferase involved in cell wall bisynthesis [Aquiflexum balticum DSM 16537]|uniref:Glycosyltransferase involved in cell wall bisynthesis n=1 Tax=Aquiflexum balticum DSM 16537 TaxID=758820 RepID=A0A1W2HCQ2_9BACT|nr:glycosyltransferase [Aquiflexum balticum]SMD46296.1 Glycosyltransferase involved in cell wall bisynthesis [Aquiflexum balticum DSM 16537]